MRPPLVRKATLQKDLGLEVKNTARHQYYMGIKVGDMLLPELDGGQDTWAKSPLTQSGKYAGRVLFFSYLD